MGSIYTGWAECTKVYTACFSQKLRGIPASLEISGKSASMLREVEMPEHNLLVIPIIPMRVFLSSKQ